MNFTTLLDNIKGKLWNLVTRDFYSEPDTSGVKTVFRLKNTKIPTEYIQDWGFISVPPEGSGECIVLHPAGNTSNGVIVKADKPESRPEGFLPGESGLFNSDGVVIKLSGKNVTITGADKIDLGEVTQSLVNESFLELFNTHVHASSGVVPTIPATDAMKTQKVSAE